MGKMNVYKKLITLIKALKSCLVTHNKSGIIQRDYDTEFASREFKQFLVKLNIEQNFGLSYHPKSQVDGRFLNKPN